MPFHSLTFALCMSRVLFQQLQFECTHYDRSPWWHCQSWHSCIQLNNNNTKNKSNRLNARGTVRRASCRAFRTKCHMNCTASYININYRNMKRTWLPMGPLRMVGVNLPLKRHQLHRQCPRNSPTSNVPSALNYTKSTCRFKGAPFEHWHRIHDALLADWLAEEAPLSEWFFRVHSTLANRLEPLV
jgi:hypothetical protein